jgi:hypothetical protein
VKMKCFRWLAKSGLITSAVAMVVLLGRRALILGSKQ